MRSHVILAALLATAGGLAQSPATHAIVSPSSLSTVTRAGVFAGNRVHSLPAGTHILRPIALSAEVPGAAAHLRITPLRDARVMGASFAWAGRAVGTTAVDVLAQAGTTGNGSPGLSLQTYSLLLGPIDARTGTLVIEFKGVLDHRALASAVVVIGDRKWEFEATSDGHKKRVAIEGLRPGANGLPVQISLSGLAAGISTPGVFGAALSLRFTGDVPPQVCRVGHDQPGCPQGGKLTGAFLSVAPSTSDIARHHLVLGLEGALPDAIGVTLLSRNGDLGRFAFTDCPIFANPLVFAVFRTDAQGNARNVIRIPNVRYDLNFFVQQVTVKFGGNPLLQIASSNTLQVKCSH